jgi:hypothetical protein
MFIGIICGCLLIAVIVCAIILDVDRMLTIETKSHNMKNEEEFLQFYKEVNSFLYPRIQK